MKRTEYSGSIVLTPEEKLQELSSEKVDEPSLPEFSREVPVSSKKHEYKNETQVDYEWKEDRSEWIKVKSIHFRKGEDLADFYRVAARDGTDSMCIRHNRITYILRKTSGAIAQALHRVRERLTGPLQGIVGYLRSVIGNCYTISRVDGQSWSFDRRLTRTKQIIPVEIDSLPEEGKGKLSELISEKIAELHSANFVIGSFTMNNVLLGDNDMKIMDLRGLRVSRKRSFAIEEFKSILQYLVSVGLAKTQDIYPCVAAYAARNESACAEWYSEKSGKRNAGLFEIASRIEQEVYG